MRPNKKNLFFCWARVAPSEYDWRGQFHQIAVSNWNSPEAYMKFDVGKILGLAAAFDSSLKKNELFKKELVTAIDILKKIDSVVEFKNESRVRVFINKVDNLLKEEE